MQMNPSIILAGTQPDFVNALRQSTAGAAEAGDFRQQNALRDLYQTQGAQIAQGDPSALAALARFDPKAALGVQGAISGERRADAQLGINQQNLDMRSREFEMRVKEHAAGLSAAEAAAQAEQIKRGILAATGAQSPEQWDQIVTQFGQPDLVGQFQNKDALLRQFMTAAQILEQGKAPKPADEYQRYVQEEEAAGRQPLSRIDFAQAKKGQETIYDSDGNIILQRGGAGGGKPPSERQSTLKLFGGLMDETMPSINQMEDDPEFDPTSLRSALADGGRVGNAVTSEKARQYEALKRQWAEGVLRIQTGAAATEPEINRVLATYFPRFGDDPRTIAQKRSQRDAFARSLVPASGGTMDAPGGASDRPRLEGGVAETYQSFDAFSQDPNVQAKAKEYGVTVQDMWDVMQGGQ